jgi:hypothetical protein
MGAKSLFGVYVVMVHGMENILYYPIDFFATIKHATDMG